MDKIDVDMSGGNKVPHGNGSDTSSQSSMMSLCSSNSTPPSQNISSHKSTCLKRKKKSRRRTFGNVDFSRLEESSDERDDDIMKRLNFDDIELSEDENNETERKVESTKKRRATLKKEAQVETETKSRRASAPQPIRNTCILESPMDMRKSSRKRRIYGIRRHEPQLMRKRPKRSPNRPMPHALCSLQRMFAE